MPRFPGIRRLFRLTGREPDVREDIDTELAFHLEERVAELVRGGMPADAARAEAERRFVDLDATRRRLEALDTSTREARQRADRWRIIGHDLRHTLRSLRRDRVFSATVVLTLGIGLGATTAMFGIIDQLLLRPPPYIADPGTLKRIYFTSNSPYFGVSTTPITTWGRYTALRDAMPDFAGSAVYYTTPRSAGSGATAEQVEVSVVSGDWFGLLGVRPALGRLITPGDDVGPAGTPVAVISDGYLHRRFGGDRGVIGAQIRIGEEQYTVIGVAPRGFRGVDLSATDVWLPLHAASQVIGSTDWEKGSYFLRVLARVPDDAVDRAAARLTALKRTALRTAVTSQGDSLLDVQLAPLILDRGPGSTPDARVALWIGGVAAIVLLVACANAAGLMLARAARRRREIALRLALGISRGRLVALLLSESLALAAAASVVALLVALWGGAVLRAVLMKGVAAGAVLDGPTILVIAGLTVAVGLTAGLGPALRASRPDLSQALKGGSRAPAAPDRLSRHGLLLAQTSLSVVLLAGAGLFVLSLYRVRGERLGFDRDGVVIATVNLADAGLGDERVSATYAAALDRLRHLPGVIAAAAASSGPFQAIFAANPVVPDGAPRPNPEATYFAPVGADFFRALGVRVLRGRTFAAADGQPNANVLVVNEPFARHTWGDADPVGRCVRLSAQAPCRVVIGEVETVRQFQITERPKEILYTPLSESGSGLARTNALFVRLRDATPANLGRVRQALQTLAPDLPYVDVRPITAFVDPQMASWRLGATLFSLFGAISLVIAAVGLYGAMQYAVTERMREMGIRMALGAQRRQVLALIIGRAVRIVLGGVLAGTVLALGAATFVAPLLYHTSPREPAVFVLVSGVLVAVAVLASVGPARAATGADPADALRAD